MAFTIFKKNTKAKAGEVNANFNFIGGNRLIGFNPIDGSPILNFNIGDLSAVGTGSLVGNFLARSGKELIVYNNAGAEIGRVSYDDLLNQGQATILVKGASFLPKQITISNNNADPNRDLDFTAGVMQFDDGSGQSPTDAITKKIDANFAIGTNQGGMPATVNKAGTYSTSGTAVTGTGTSFDTDFLVGDVIFSSSNNIGRRITNIADATNMTISSAFPIAVSGDTVQKNGLAPDTTYHIFALSSTNLFTDAGFDTQPNASNLLSDSTVISNNLTKKIKIASLITNSSSNIRTGKYLFFKDGSYQFIYNSAVQEVSGAGTYPLTLTDLQITTPIGIKVSPSFDCLVQSSGTDGVAIADYDTSTEYKICTCANTIATGSLASGALYTNTNSQVKYRNSGLTAFVDFDFNIKLCGWIDNNL